MGLHLPRKVRRLTAGAGLAATLLLVSACSARTETQWKKFGQPPESPITVQGHTEAALWKWSWVAALVVGVVVWALIGFAVVRYRRRSDDEVPVQTRYNLPLEIFYTIAPVIMVVVLFFHTVEAQNVMLKESKDPDHVVDVVGQQWSWTFNYKDEAVADGKNVYTSGTASQIPTLVLAVDESVRFDLYSPDVIHDFYVPAFLMKMDIIPGRVNSFEVTPNQIGDYLGKCAEFCGTYHSRMVFNVKVVSHDDYEAYLQKQIAAGFSSDQPLLGGSDARTQAGLHYEGADR